MYVLVKSKTLTVCCLRRQIYIIHQTRTCNTPAQFACTQRYSLAWSHESSVPAVVYESTSSTESCMPVFLPKHRRLIFYDDTHTVIQCCTLNITKHKYTKLTHDTNYEKIYAKWKNYALLDQEFSVLGNKHPFFLSLYNRDVFFFILPVN